MPLVKINLVSSTGPKLQGQPDLSITGEITETYDIFTDDRSENNIVVADYLPGSMFGYYPDSNNMFIQTYRDVEFSKHVTQPFHGSRWTGTLKYTRRSRTKPLTPKWPSPSDPYAISFSFANRQEVLEVDRFGNIVQNTIGDKFDTPPMARVNEPSFMISRTEFYNPISKLMNYSPKYGAVNSNGIWGFNPRTLLLNIGAEYKSDSGWSVKYQFTFNYDTWDYSTLNAGYYEISGSPTPERKRILDDTADEKPIQKPKALSDSGSVLPDGSPGYFLYWEKALPLDFYSLGLPNITTVW